MGEDAKVAERNNRREAMEALKKLKTDKTISEDESAASEKEVEKMVADAVSQIDTIMAAKEKEIMTV
jgi:ribosome recycling factor